jgi:hypothetical protein
MTQRCHITKKLTSNLASYRVHEHLDEADVVHDHNDDLRAELRRLGPDAPGERPSVFLLVQHLSGDTVNDGRDLERLVELDHPSSSMAATVSSITSGLPMPAGGAVVEREHVRAGEVVGRE